MSLCGYRANQQVVKMHEDKRLIVHNFAKHNYLCQDLPMFGICNYILMREK